MSEVDNKSKRDILIDSILKKSNKYSREQIDEMLKKKEENILDLVLRQTDMQREQAIILLEKNDYHSINTIKEYYGIQQKNINKTDEIININQEIYKEIRGFMDNASKKYRLSKEMEARREEILNDLKLKQKNSLSTINEDTLHDSEEIHSNNNLLVTDISKNTISE